MRYRPWDWRFLPYAVAIGSTALALFLSLMLESVIFRMIGAFFYIAIASSTWYGGIRPGSVTILLSMLVLDYYFMPPLHQLGIADFNDGLRLLLFVIVSLIITLLSSNLRASRQKVEQLNRQLLNESAERLQVALQEAQTSKALLQQQFEQQRLVIEITQRIRQSLTLSDILQTTVDEVRHLLQVDRVIIFQFSPEWRGIVTVESVVTPDLAILPFDIYDPCIGEKYVQPFRQGLVTAKADIYSADIDACHVEFLAQFKVRANLVVPILKNNELWGLLAAHHCTAPRLWQDSEIDLLRQIASQVSIALQQSALLEQVKTELNERKQTETALQQLNQELEQRVEERTADLTVVNDRLLNSLLELHRSKQETEDLYNNAPCGYHSLDASGTIIRINQTELNWLGYTHDEVLHQKKFLELMTLESQTVFHDGFAQFMQQGWIKDLELQLLSKDGSTRWVNLNSTAITNEAGEFVMSRTILFDVDDRKRIEAERSQTEAALRDSEAQFRQLVENLEAVFWIRNGQKPQVIYVSPAYETIWQQSCDSLYLNFSTWIESIHPDDRDRVETAALQLSTIGHYDQEYRILRPDGSIRWIRDRAFSINSEAGTLLRVAGLAEDITDRKQTETALQQQTQQERLRWNITQAIRQSLNLPAILNTTVEAVRHTLQVDRAAVYRFQPDWSGTFVAESVGAEWVNLVNSEVPKRWEDTYLQDTQGGRFQNHEVFVIPDLYTAGLQPCHLDLLEQFQAKAYAIAPIFSGSTLWGLLAIYQNTTPRDWQCWEVELLQQIASQLSIALQQAKLYNQLQSELQERQQATAVIREAERRWRSLLDNVQLIVVGLDLSGHVNYTNPFFLSLTGYTEAEILGKDWFTLFVPDSTQESIHTVFSEILAQNAHSYHQNSILTKSGEERCIAWNNTILQDSEGNRMGIISIGEDITERQRVEKMKNEFIGIVSHELRTPLTSIRGSLGLLATGVMDDEPDEMKRMIEIAAIDTERLVRLVNDVLDLEKLESGKVSLVREWCDVADLMQRSLEIMESSAQEVGVQLVVHPVSVQIWVAPDRIIQTLTNLLSNAIKFSPVGGTVTVSAEIRQLDSRTPESRDMGNPEALKRLVSSSFSTSPTHLLFSVQDQGRGIPANKLETIFGRFQQVDASDSREKGGTGLGLAICKSIVQQHDGQIWVESNWGQGSTFFFSLPLPTR